HFIFQPAEEHGKGALSMMQDGLFERFPMSSVFAIHNMPNIAPGIFGIRDGAMMACEDNFEITITGKGAHAALPHLGVDPIVIGSEIVLALQTIISRKLDPLDQGVISVTEFTTDGTRNVIPETVTLKGDCRAYLPEVQDLFEAKIENIVKGICLAHDAEYQFSYSREFASTLNSVKEAEAARKTVLESFGAEYLAENCPPVMASEDFGFMLQQKAGAYIFLGNGGGGPGGCGLHNPNYDFNDDILASGIKFWISLVERQLPLDPES
ncbi:MAG: amidohydrolase, partial [Alphaproteobacteria bacterium]|nr:amidohydrolase [Alphaproteobacteria bacterium]